MEEEKEVKNEIKQYPKGKTVHHVLARSYLVYFSLLILGIALDEIFKIKVFHDSTTIPIGFLFLIFATILIIWAQTTSKKLPETNIKKEHFCRGPYCYTRTPTHWGLFLLVLAFGVILNAFFVIITTIISFILTKFIFVKKQETMLAEKYGEPYIEYTNEVKW